MGWQFGPVGQDTRDSSLGAVGVALSSQSTGPPSKSCTNVLYELYNVTMVKISVSKARERLAEVVEMSQSEPVELEHYGRRAAVLVSPEQYDQMLEALEESEDVVAFDAALSEAGASIPWEQVRRDLDWS